MQPDASAFRLIRLAPKQPRRRSAAPALAPVMPRREPDDSAFRPNRILRDGVCLRGMHKNRCGIPALDRLERTCCRAISIGAVVSRGSYRAAGALADRLRCPLRRRASHFRLPLPPPNDGTCVTVRCDPTLCQRTASNGLGNYVAKNAIRDKIRATTEPVAAFCRTAQGAPRGSPAPVAKSSAVRPPKLNSHRTCSCLTKS
jgi:hypothetical protein